MNPGRALPAAYPTVNLEQALPTTFPLIDPRKVLPTATRRLFIENYCVYRERLPLGRPSSAVQAQEDQVQAETQSKGSTLDEQETVTENELARFREEQKGKRRATQERKRGYVKRERPVPVKTRVAVVHTESRGKM